MEDPPLALRAAYGDSPASVAGGFISAGISPERRKGYQHPAASYLQPVFHLRRPGKRAQSRS